MAGTELIKAGSDSPFTVLQMESDELSALVSENIGTDSLTVADLDRVSVPAGGGQVWEVPSVNGVDATRVIEGVIVHRASRRAYWKDAYDGGTDPPNCASDDCVTGVGDPGGVCADCPMSQWESAGDGKACKESRQLFVLTKDSLIPIVVTCPSTSVNNVRTYFLRLMKSRLASTDVVTRIGLEKAVSKSGFAYSRVTLSAGERLDPEAASRLRAYATALEPAFRAAARVERDEV